MDVYTFCLTLGFVGLAAMAVLGAAHMGGHHGHGGHGHGGHGSDLNLHGTGGAHAGGAAHGALSHNGAGHGGGHVHHSGHSHASHHAHGQHGSHSLTSRFDIFALLSPRVWFSVMLGLGAVGTLLKHPLPLEPWRFVVALIGGISFEKLMMAPTWNAWMSFASRPARTLESAVAEEARAATNFDIEGHGLISLDLDGQVLQLLGRLSEGQRREGVTVRNGDRLFVEDVDTARNRCTVSKLD